MFSGMTPDAVFRTDCRQARMEKGDQLEVHRNNAGRHGSMDGGGSGGTGKK